MGGGGEQTSSTQVNYPPEYKALMTAVAAKAQDVANLPLTQYTGDRVANLAPDTLSAFDLARQSIGSTDQINQSALGALNNYGNYSGLDTGVQALDAMGNPQNYSNLNMVSPLVSNALPALNSSAAGYTQNLLNSTGANAKLPDVIQNYMNPYTNDVVNQIGALGQRDLTENILPAVSKAYIGGGIFGGNQNQEMISRALRDTGNNILGQQTNALNTQYNTAASQAQADLDRLTGQAQNLGSQYGSDLSRTLSGTTDLSNLLTTAGTSDADRATAAAQYLQGLGSTDAANQLTYGQNLQNYGTNIYNQNLKDSAVLEGIGQEQQQQEQNEINAQMQQFQEAADYPAKQLQTLNLPLQNVSIQPNTTTTQSSSGGSPFGSILGGIIGLGSLAVPGASGVSALGNLSDRRMKKDISPLGMVSGSKADYPLYGYKYKGTHDPQIGVMAQDVEKVNPSAVGEVNGMKYVNYEALREGGSVLNRYASGGSVGDNIPYDRILDILNLTPAMRQTKARGGQIGGSNYWGQDDLGYPRYADQEELGWSDIKKNIGNTYDDNFDRGIVRNSNPAGGGMEMREEPFLDGADRPWKREHLPVGMTLGRGGAVHGYADGGSILDDLFKMFAASSAQQSPLTMGSAPAIPSEILDNIKRLTSDKIPAIAVQPSKPTMDQVTRQLPMTGMSEPETQQAPSVQSPLVPSGNQQWPPSPVPWRETNIGGNSAPSPDQITWNGPRQGEAPLSAGGIQWNGPRQVPGGDNGDAAAQQTALNQAMNQGLPPNMQRPPMASPQSPLVPVGQGQPAPVAAPQTTEQMIQQLVKNQYDDRLRSALLHMSAGMMSSNGNFGQQLGAGVSAGIGDLDKSKENYQKGMLDLYGIQAKNADWKQQVAMMRAMNGQNAVDNKDDSKRAELASKMLENLPLNDPRRAGYQKIVDGYAGVGGGATGTPTPGGGTQPAPTIAASSGNVPQAAIDYLKGHPDQASFFEKKYGVPASQYLQ